LKKVLDWVQEGGWIELLKIFATQWT